MAMQKLLYILASLLILVGLTGCEDTFTGPERPPSANGSGEIIFSRLNYSRPEYWQFSSIDVLNLATGRTRMVVNGSAYLLCAPQGGRIVYAEYDDTQATVFLKTSKTDGTDVQIVDAFNGDIIIDRATLSPDGKKIAYVITFHSSSSPPVAGYFIVLYNIASGEKSVIDYNESGGSKPSVFVTHISFSPDGTYIGAVKWEGQGYIQLYSGSDGSLGEVFATSVGPHFDWSQDGRRIAYSFNPSLFLYEYDRGNLVMAASSPSCIKIGAIGTVVSDNIVDNLPLVWDVTLSHDGRRMAISQYRQDAKQSYTTDIISFALATPERIDILTLGSDEGHRGRLQWSKDDSQLLYSLSDNPAPGLLYGQIARINMKEQTHREEILERLAYDGYWYTN